MSAALNLVADLSHRRIQVYWGGESLRLRGDLGRLTAEHRQELRRHRQDLEAMAKWQSLQDGSEAKYRNACARFYPFCRLELEDAPAVRTAAGEARIAQVMPDHLRVVMEADMREWRSQCVETGKRLPYPAPMRRMEFSQVSPPVAAPDHHQTEMEMR